MNGELVGDARLVGVRCAHSPAPHVFAPREGGTFLPEHVPLYSFINAITASAKAAAPARRLELEAVAGELLEQHVGRAS